MDSGKALDPALRGRKKRKSRFMHIVKQLLAMNSPRAASDSSELRHVASTSVLEPQIN